MAFQFRDLMVSLMGVCTGTNEHNCDDECQGQSGGCPAPSQPCPPPSQPGCQGQTGQGGQGQGNKAVAALPLLQLQLREALSA